MGVIQHTPGEYPRYVHHKAKAPRLVHTKEEHLDLRQQGFVDSYVPQDYPKHLHKGTHTRTVKNAAEETALKSKGWKDTAHLQAAAAKGEGHKHHQLLKNPDGSLVPEDERFLQGPEEPDLDGEDGGDGEEDEGRLEPEPEPIVPRGRKKRPAAKKAAATKAAPEPATE